MSEATMHEAVIGCAECGTLDPPDPTFARLCFWCAELHRLNPVIGSGLSSISYRNIEANMRALGVGPQLPDALRPPERR